MRSEMKAARAYGRTASEWDALSEDDKDWALASILEETCPNCAGHDPEQLCQNPKYQHAWIVDTKRCYKSKAVLMAMERFKNDPYASAVVTRVRLDESLAKPDKPKKKK